MLLTKDLPNSNRFELESIDSSIWDPPLHIRSGDMQEGNVSNSVSSARKGSDLSAIGQRPLHDSGAARYAGRTERCDRGRDARGTPGRRRGNIGSYFPGRTLFFRTGSFR